tara:strand:- start:2421 stop:3470 length:1050 start_codon:yes stop_codon:yes gene_type:complete
MKSIAIVILVTLLAGCGMTDSEVKIKVQRFEDGPIIPPLLSKEIGTNVQGPSLIKIPGWVKSPLGKYYLYFADHKGHQIKLAYADNIKGPWKIRSGGTLLLENSLFLVDKPAIPKDFDVESIKPRKAHPDLLPYIPKKIDDLTIPHIASPDVHVDDKNKRIIMYFHGLDEFGLQKTRVAASNNGLDFNVKKKIVGWPYFRKFTYKENDYAISMPGVIYKNTGDIDDFTQVNQILEGNVRHSAVLVCKDQLLIFFTRKGDKPERILLSIVDLNMPSIMWKASKVIEVLRPEKDWEGGNLPLYESTASAINTPVNQLRDPAIFVEEQEVYLLYSVRGENGIAIAKINIKGL